MLMFVFGGIQRVFSRPSFFRLMLEASDNGRRYLSMLLLMPVFCGINSSHVRAEKTSSQAKKIKLAKQMKCLQKCQNQVMRRASYCRKMDQTSPCFWMMQFKVSACFRSCNAPWFCFGVQQSFRQCPTNCLKDLNFKRLQRLKKKRYVPVYAKRKGKRLSKKGYAAGPKYVVIDGKKMTLKHPSKKRKKVVRWIAVPRKPMSKKRLARWAKRSANTCVRFCRVLGAYCGVHKLKL